MDIDTKRNRILPAPTRSPSRARATPNRTGRLPGPRWLARALLLVVALLGSAALAAGAEAAEADSAAPDGDSFTALVVENDGLTGQGLDRWYTGGLQLAYATEAHPPPRWLQQLGRHGAGLDVGADALWGLSVAQRAFTPANITDPEMPPADRPYAGWLNVTLGIAERTPDSLGRLRLGLGVTGEPALAEQIQQVSHDLFGSDEPVGWDSQLPSEPTFQVAYDRQWTVQAGPLAGPLRYRLDTATGASLGTALTQAGAGLSASIGQRLPRDHGPPRLSGVSTGSLSFDSAAGAGWYATLGANARLVAHNLFLDGTVFRDSPSVEREPAVTEAYAGLVAYRHRLRLSVTWIRRSKAFKRQEEAQGFGVATLTWAH